MKIALFFALFAVTAAAQQTVPITLSGTVSIPASSCSYNASTSILTINGVAITKLSLAEIDLTGGVIYPDGLKAASFKSGALTYVPLPTLTSGVTPAYIPVTIPATPSVGPSSVVKVPFTAPAGKFLSVYPQSYPGDPWQFQVFPGIVQVRNTGYTRINFPATVVLVEAR